MNDAPRPATPAARESYAAPEVLPLGRVRSLTAGPVQDQDKNLDQIFGGSGGFARAHSDPVS